MPFETCLVNTWARWMTLPLVLDDEYALLMVNICACPSLEAPVLMYQGFVLAGWGDKCKKESLIILDLQQLASLVYTCMIIFMCTFGSLMHVILVTGHLRRMDPSILGKK